MASISYTLKVAPYEVAEYPGSRFDKRSEILDTKTIRLEFDLETLPVEDRTLFWNVLGIQPKIAFGKNTNIVLMTYELDRGYDPTGIEPLPSVRRYHQLIQQLRDVQTELSRVESADRFNGLILKADEMLGDLINALLILGD